MPCNIDVLVNDARADVDFETETGKTALIVAATNNNDNIIRKLVDALNVNRKQVWYFCVFGVN